MGNPDASAVLKMSAGENALMTKSPVAPEKMQKRLKPTEWSSGVMFRRDHSPSQYKITQVSSHKNPNAWIRRTRMLVMPEKKN